MQVPPSLGPYRFVRPLGSGGIGDVYLAHDARLDRPVAVKILRPRQDVTDELRRRFHQEAQLAASLNHPAIVHVYDVVREPELDAIVMEYVEGGTLRERLEDARPLALAQVVGWARQIAGGMAAAHQAGIVHRDLKSENVLLTTAQDQAKISDFGIARRLDAETAGTGGSVVGTFRAMSPEQASGQPLDHRSDLFSFGVLLYEVLSGASPFLAATPLETLERVVRAPHRPLGEARPGLPAELGALVDRLLAKDPALRPRDFLEVSRALEALARDDGETGKAPLVLERSPVAEVATPGGPGPRAAIARPGERRAAAWRWRWPGLAAALLAAVAATLAFSRNGTSPGEIARPAEPRYAAVLAPRTSSDRAEDLDFHATSLRLHLVRGLSELEGLVVEAPADVDRVATPAMSLREVARAVAADELVSSRLECSRGVCTVTLERVRGREGTVAWSAAFQVPEDDFAGLDDLVATHLRRGFADHPAPRASRPRQVDDRDDEAYLRLYHGYLRKDPALTAEVIHQRLGELRERSPGFLAAYLLEADIARTRSYLSSAPADLELARRLSAAARQMAPESAEAAALAFKVAMAGGDIPRATRELEDLERLSQDQAMLWHLRAELLAQRGELAQAVELLRRAAGRHPSWRILISLADAELHLGQPDAARGHLQELLSRAPEHFTALSMLAQLELISGSASRAVEMYSRLHRRSPAFTEASNLGIALLVEGRYGEARGRFEQALAEQPMNAAAVFNLADAELLLGRRDEAMARYRRVVELLSKAPDGDWASLTSRAQALAHLGQPERAVADLQRALRLAPADNGDVAYAAAAVYAIVGDRASATANRDRALRLGYAPHWFRFPWFDAVRGN